MSLLDGSPDLWVHPVNFDYLSTLSDLLQFGYVRRSTIQTATTRKLRNLDRDAKTKLFLKGFANQVPDLNENYVRKLVEPITVKEDPLRAIATRDRYSTRDFFFTFLESTRLAYDDRPFSPQHYVFKSVETAYIENYYKVFPEMRFINVVRHPFSNFSSVKRSLMAHKHYPFWFLGGDQLKTFLEKRWIPHVRFIAKYHSLERDKHFVVKYEELCERPSEVIKDICRWLKVRPPAEPPVQTFLGGKRMRELPVLPSKKGIVTPHRVVRNMAAEYGYEEVLTEREREFILLRTYKFGVELGYFEPIGEHELPSKVILARKWFFPDSWELRNARPRIRLLLALVMRRFYIYSRLLFGNV